MVSLVLRLLLLGAASPALAATISDYASHDIVGRSVVVTSATGQKLRVTPYGPGVTRIQAVADGQSFWSDEHYETVLSHDAGTRFDVEETADRLELRADGTAPYVVIDKTPLRVRIIRGESSILTHEEARGLETGERPLRLLVDGREVATVPFSPTDEWTKWHIVSVSVPLTAGAHQLTLTSKGWSGPNVDYMEVVDDEARRFEAETASLHGVQQGSQHEGYSGRGYADFQGASGESITWHVAARTSGTHALSWRYANGSAVGARFEKAANEHFTGLGHGTFGHVDSLDLSGQRVARNRANQATLTVPFFLSSKGYGVFVNNAFPNEFSFLDDDYGVRLAGGQVDYFVIDGPELTTVLDRYTQLTGRPNLPPLALFGLGLSDKLEVDLPSSATWWQDKATRMHEARYPFSLIIHDNSWRNGKSAPWEWDLSRYPDPASFEAWCRARGIANMLDFNRDNAGLSDGWRPEYAIPGTRDFPDFTSPEVRQWFFDLLWTKSLDPALDYPGDMLWLDEFDEPVVATAPLANGRGWDETANQYLFLLAKAVGEGWQKGYGDGKRSFFMARGMSAGAQRWSSLWSGDINASDEEMSQQIRGLLASGLSGFPYWAHDAGGFMSRPSDDLYRRWALGMGSFTPVWKPHGPGLRFPWQFDARSQAEMHRFGELRMRLLPYNYTYAYLAHRRGTPMARALLLEYPERAEAWRFDQEYLWGRELLIVPEATRPARFWLPPGTWYDYWTGERLAGDLVHTLGGFAAPVGLFVRAGAIVPLADVALTPGKWNKARLTLRVQAGADGEFEWLDDDGETGRHARGERASTIFRYEDATKRLVIDATRGAYPGAPSERSYALELHGAAEALSFFVDGEPLPVAASLDDARRSERAMFWDHETKVAYVFIGRHAVDREIVVETR